MSNTGRLPCITLIRQARLFELALDVFKGAIDGQHVKSYDGHGYGDVGQLPRGQEQKLPREVDGGLYVAHWSYVIGYVVFFKQELEVVPFFRGVAPDVVFGTGLHQWSMDPWAALR